MYPHRIRLHGPWNYEPVVRTRVHPNGRIEELDGEVPEPGRTKLPATYSGTPLAGFRGRVRWTRAFHAPRSLESHEQLWVCFRAADYHAEVTLNGATLGCHAGYFEPFEFEITPVVRERNELTVEIDCPAESDLDRRGHFRGELETESPQFVGGLWRDIVLEVRSIAFLRDVQISSRVTGQRGQLEVSGSVIGESDQRLGLDLSVDGHVIETAEVRASGGGSEFNLRSDLGPVDLWRPGGGPVRLYHVLLELHGAARTLDTVETQVGFREIDFQAGSGGTLSNGHTPVHCVRLPPKWLVDDPLLTHVSDRSLRALIEHPGNPIVAVRVAGRVAAKEFYCAADRAGVSLCQDLPFGAHHDPAVHDEGMRQACALVTQLRSHPSIAAWSVRLGRADEPWLNSLVAAVRSIDSERPIWFFRHCGG